MPLTIRLLRTQDLVSLHELLSDEEVMKYLEPVYSMEKTRSFLNQAGLGDKPLIYAVDEDGVFIGYVIYHDYDDSGMEIGWVLKRDVWGKGYANELTEQLIARAFAQQKDVVIECVPEQDATKAIAKRYGFRYCGQEDGCEIYRLDQRTTESV